MSKTIDAKRSAAKNFRVATADPKARLDAWERARGTFSKKRMKEILRDLRAVRKEWAA